MPDTTLKFVCSACDRIVYRRPFSKRKKGVTRERLETKKFCPFCRQHTLHKETK